MIVNVKGNIYSIIASLLLTTSDNILYITDEDDCSKLRVLHNLNKVEDCIRESNNMLRTDYNKIYTNNDITIKRFKVVNTEYFKGVDVLHDPDLYNDDIKHIIVVNTIKDLKITCNNIAPIDEIVDNNTNVVSSLSNTISELDFVNRVIVVEK